MKKFGMRDLKLWLLLNAALFQLLMAQSPSIKLGWSPNTEPGLDHYVVYRDTIPGTMVYHDTVSKTDSIYLDEAVSEGKTYYYKITAIDNLQNESDPTIELTATAGVITGVDDGASNLVNNFELKQNYPNPFNPTTTIPFYIPEQGAVKIIVYNTLGQEVKTLVNEVKQPGDYQINWDGTDNSGNPVASGIYYYQMISANFHKTKKAIFQK